VTDEVMEALADDMPRLLLELPMQAITLFRQPLGKSKLGAEQVRLGHHDGEPTADRIGIGNQVEQDEMIRKGHSGPPSHETLEDSFEQKTFRLLSFGKK
jgi:hypothetical protein